MAATAEQPAYNPERTLEEWAEVLAGLQAPTLAALERVARAVAAARVREDSTELVMAMHRLADLQGTMLDASRVLAQAGAVQSFEQIQAQAREQQAHLAAVPDPAPRRARHRASRKRDPGRPLMRPVQGIAPLAAAGAAFRHSWLAAHPAVAGTLAAGAVAATVTTAVVAPHAAATFGLGTPATAPAPAASIWGATPITVPVAVASAVTRPSQPAKPLTALGPSAMPPYLPAVWSPAPSGSGGASQPAPAGTLTVSQMSLDLTGSGTGQIAISCSGGPCVWHVVVGGPLSADTRRGTLQDGQTATVTITCDPSALLTNGNQTITVWPGDGRVIVTWTAPPPLPADPSPTDAPTVTPPATPTAPPTS